MTAVVYVNQSAPAPCMKFHKYATTIDKTCHGELASAIKYCIYFSFKKKTKKESFDLAIPYCYKVFFFIILH